MMKEEIRAQISLLKKQNRDQLAYYSKVCMQKLENHPLFQQAHTVMAYYSMKGELDTQNFLEKHYPFKRILLPVVVGDDIQLKLFQGREKMIEGAFHILEPAMETFEENLSSIDLVLVPGLAFDKKLNRMGRGRGYYDRFLPKIPKAHKIGLCFPFQLVDEVPVLSHDIPMDEIIY